MKFSLIMLALLAVGSTVTNGSPVQKRDALAEAHDHKSYDYDYDYGYGYDKKKHHKSSYKRDASAVADANGYEKHNDYDYDYDYGYGYDKKKHHKSSYKRDASAEANDYNDYDPYKQNGKYYNPYYNPYVKDYDHKKSDY